MTKQKLTQITRPKEISAAGNTKQLSAKKRPRASIEPPGPPSGAPPSKELRPKPSSILSRRYKFERGPTVFYCDYVTNVTYKIQYKYPNCNFSKVFYRISNQNIPMAEILSELKKRRRRILAFNINEGS